MYIDIKGIIDEDFVNYKKPSMVIEFPYCSFKCDKECGMQVCQNSTLATSCNITIKLDNIVQHYINNDITQAIIFQGLEPFDSMQEMLCLIRIFRQYTQDDIVIYTGYYKQEIEKIVLYLSQTYNNIIIKFGRYIPNKNKRYDNILGVELASDNQYAEKIS